MVDRLAIVRSPAKVEAAKFIPHYELGLGEKCQARVKSLLENFSFHFPGSWGGPNGQVRLPFVSSITVATSLIGLAT